jgi:hypothetical protein
MFATFRRAVVEQHLVVHAPVCRTIVDPDTLDVAEAWPDLHFFRLGHNVTEIDDDEPPFGEAVL